MGKTLKKGFSVFLVVIMLLSSVPMGVFGDLDFGLSASAAGGSVAKFITNVSQKSYVPSGYTGIYTASDLYNIRNNSSGKYILMNDIDLLTWGEWKSFNANGLTLDGNGYSICNLVNYEYGFINRATNGATITNLGFENVYIDSTYSSVGGIMGYARNVTITNCYVTGTIAASSTVGGLCGEYDWGDYINITSCYNFADVSGRGYVGGIAGYVGAWQFEDVSFIKCFNRGNITAEEYDVGGIVGYTYGYGDQTDLYVKECANLGSVKGKKNVGGIGGRISGTFAYVRTLDCYNTGNIRGTENVGGLYGDASRMVGSSYNIGSVSGSTNVDAVIGLPDTTLYNCFYLNIMTSKTNAKALSSSAMKKESSFVNGSNYPFDFTNIWKTTSGYPTLRCFSRMSWAFDNETFNEIVSQYYADGKIKICVYANPAYGFVEKEVTGAVVSIYFGASLIKQYETMDGETSFDVYDCLKKGYRLNDILKNATISAHYEVESTLRYSLELCSECIDENGVWRGENIGAALSGASYIELCVDEPRWLISMTVGYAGKDLKFNISGDKFYEYRYDVIDAAMKEFAKGLAQMTNGHVLLDRYSILRTDYDATLEKSDLDIKIYKNDGVWPHSSIDGFFDSSKDIELSYKYLKEKGYRTLCHEAGHYLFGLLDEYCYGWMYYYDTNNDGTTCGEFIKVDHQGNFSAGGCREEHDHPDIKNSGYFDRTAFIVPSITGRSRYSEESHKLAMPTVMNNFGIMNRENETLELSDKSKYDYLNGIAFNPDTPEIYPMQYYVYKQSTEDTMISYLAQIFKENGYIIDYTETEGKTQTADYWYAVANSADDSIPVLLEESGDNCSRLDIAEETDEPLVKVDFSLNDQNLIISMPELTEAYLKNIDGQSVDKLEDSSFVLSVEDLIGNSMFLSIVKENDGVLMKNIYTIYLLENNSDKQVEMFSAQSNVYVIETNIKQIEDIKESINNTYIILSTDENVSGRLETSISTELLINYDSLTWCKYDTGSWSEIESNSFIGEYDIMHVSANFNGVGTYVLMTDCVNEDVTVLQPTDVIVNSEDTIYDDQLNISFSDPNEDSLFYKVYYELTNAYNLNNAFSKCETFSAENTTLRMNFDKQYGEYTIALQIINKSGAMSELYYLTSYVQERDTDNDGIPDYWIDIYYPLKDLEDIANTDCDDDGLNNLQEYQLGTDPLNFDTDSDNVPDNIELQNNLDPLKQCTDDVSNDYVVVYGEPDVGIKNVTFDDSNLTFDLVNNTDGKAVRNFVAVEVDGEEVAMWTVNIDTQSTVGFTVPLADIEGCESLVITSDEGQITHDKDYTNNTFTYSPASSIAFEKESFEGIKGNNIVPTLVLEPDTANEIFAWSIEGAPNLSIDSSTGVVTSNGIGTGKVTVKTLGGLTAICDVYSIAFEGAEYSEFDSKLINNGTEVAITGYIGDDSSIIIPETIASLPVTQLASNAFKGCSFNEVTIHSGINSIANNTFSDTISLERIVVDEANTSYCSDDGILYSSDKTQLVKYPSAKTDTIFAIPETVASIGAYSLNDCDYIEEITVPESVTSIGNSAISNCDNLKTVNYNAISCSTPSGFSALLYGVFNSSNQIEKVIIGDKVKVIPQYLFYNRSNLSEVIISDNSNLLTIAQCAFYGCSKLTSLDIPKTVTTIGSSAFYGCNKLDNVILPEALVSIGSSAFSGCSSLTSIIIPETIKTIDSNTFNGCSNLSDVTLPKTLTSIGTSAFSGCSSLASIVIPETVTSIPDNCFTNCTSLEKIVIPAQIDTIGETPFNGCSNVVIWCFYKSVAYEYAIANLISYKVMELDTEDLIVTGVQETIVEGLQYQITTEISPVDSDETVIYSSSDDNIFSVTDTGLLTAKGAGEAILTVASSRGSVSKTFTINVLGLSKDSENTKLYHVRNADDMLTLSTMVNSGVSFAGKIIQLDNDIDLSNIDWTPIGIDSTYVFSGVFDGKNHTISGFNYETTSNTYSGLFGYIKTGGVKDLTVEGSVNGVNRVGMLAGCIFDSALYNCKVIGEVKRIGSGSYGYVGGLVGSALHSVIINCAAETDITTDFGDSSINYAAVGGIVGAASTAGSDPMCILNSYCIGDISVSGNNYAYENYYVGGIAGYLKDDAANNYYFGEITNADGDTIKRIGYAFGYVVPEYTSESDYNGIGTIIVQDNYYLEGKNAIGLISEGDYDSSNWVSPISEENFSKLIGKGSLVNELNGNKSAVEEIIVAHRDILSNSTWAELVDRINGDSFIVSSWKIGSNNLPVNYECDCYRHAESEWIIDVEATCTKEGSKHTYCLVCQETVTTSIIEKAEHKFSDWTETKAATCTEKGSEYRTCTTCNSATETRDIAELGHNFVGEWTTDKAPTCTKSGVESRICTRCKSEKETRTVDKLGHDFESKWTVDKEATCSKVGSKSHHCSRCDEKSDVTVVNKIAHTYRESVQEATCTKDGKKTYNCSACGDSYSEVITAKGHIDQNGDGKCDNCDYIYDNTCDHMCHKSGFMGFVWKIVRFFWKLFKMNPVCECGVSHY